jgi:nucleoside-diphosphate-sugar epimerase
LVEAFAEFIRAPRAGEVYNIGGSRHSNCSMLEAIEMCEEISGKKLNWSYEEASRIGDHIWWISDVRKFQRHYPQWKFRYEMREISGRNLRCGAMFVIRESSRLRQATASQGFVNRFAIHDVTT